MPLELVIHIVKKVAEQPPPSEARLHDEPSSDFFSSSLQSLKALSLCNHTLRDLSTPYLFQHIIVDVEAAVGDVIDVVLDKTRGKGVDSLLICAPKTLRDKVEMSAQERMARNLEGLRDIHQHLRENNVELRDLSPIDASENDEDSLNDEDRSLASAACLAIHLLLSEFNPRVLTVALPPHTIANLVSAPVELYHETPFHLPLQILRLELDKATLCKCCASSHNRSSDSEDEAEEEDDTNEDGEDSDKSGEDSNEGGEDSNSKTGVEDSTYRYSLFRLRPWAHITFNAGSSLPAYQAAPKERNYPEHPSWVNDTHIFPDDAKSALVPLLSGIESFTFIGSYCFSGTYTALGTLVRSLKNLKALRIRMLPLAVTQSVQGEKEYHRDGATRQVRGRELVKSVYTLCSFMLEVGSDERMSLQEFKLLDFGRWEKFNGVAEPHFEENLDESVWLYEGKGLYLRKGSPR